MITLILTVLCAYRLTQLVVWDAILSPVTSWLASKHRLLDELLCCAHCVGFWCAVVSVVAVSQDHWAIRIGVWALAVSGAVSMIQHATGWLDTEVPELPPYPSQEPAEDWWTAPPPGRVTLEEAERALHGWYRRHQAEKAAVNQRSSARDEPKGDGE